MRRTRLLSSSSIALILALACGGNTSSPSPNDQDNHVCGPGETQLCAGLNEEGPCDGVQSCNDAGTGWTSCDCAPSPPSGGDNNGGGGGGGSTGNGGGTSGGGITGNGGGTGGGNTSDGGMGGDGNEDDPQCRNHDFVPVERFSDIHQDAKSLHLNLTFDEKRAILSGGPPCPNYDCDFDSTGVPRLNMKDLAFRGGGRGVRTHTGDETTTFAVAIARAASFDVDLEKRVGETIGVEMRALGYDVLMAPMLNTLRHPGWGEAQSAYGEDPIVQGKLGAAFVNGAQERVIACPFAYVGQTTGENRATVNNQVDDQTLRENYLLPFKIAIEEAEPGCLIAAYSRTNGVHMTEHQPLLTGVLRDDWNWNGFVTSQWWGTTPSAGTQTLNAGLDLEMPEDQAFETLTVADTTRINEASLRILNVRAHMGHFSDGYTTDLDTDIADTPEHMALARETAEKGAVLLENDGILPIEESVTSIVLMGPDIDLPTNNTSISGQPHGLGDRGGDNNIPPYAVSYLDGITARASNVTVTHSATPADAAGKDLVIIPITMAHEDEGEAFGGGGDREDLLLSTGHPTFWSSKPAQFIADVAAVNPNVIVVLAVGSGVLVEEIRDKARAIVQTFYPGQEAGNAIAGLLFGDKNFSGRLPFTVATQEEDYPVFGHHSDAIKYDYLHGYRLFESEGIEPRYWFGHGLSYTTFSYSDLEVLCSQVGAGGTLLAEVTIENTGLRSGTEVVQAYIGYPNTAERRPIKELKAFQRVELEPGESKTIRFEIPARDFAYWDDVADEWIVEPIIHDLVVAASSDPNDPNLLVREFEVVE